MTKDEALKLALEALEFANVNHWWGSSNIEQAITAAKEALAQPPLPVSVPADADADEMNRLHGEGYGVDWEYPDKEQPEQWANRAKKLLNVFAENDLPEVSGCITKPKPQPEQPKPTDELYNELLFAVGNKYPNETRHQTALRYIQQAETCGAQLAKAHTGATK